MTIKRTLIYSSIVILGFTYMSCYSHPDTVQVKKFEVVDDEGRPRVRIEVNNDGEPHIIFLDADGKTGADMFSYKVYDTSLDEILKAFEAAGFVGKRYEPPLCLLIGAGACHRLKGKGFELHVYRYFWDKWAAEWAKERNGHINGPFMLTVQKGDRDKLIKIFDDAINGNN